MKNFINGLLTLFVLTTTIGAGGACCRTVQQSLNAAIGDNDYSFKISNPGGFDGVEIA